MNNIQIGIDIATSISVIGAAIYFVYSTAQEGYKNRSFSIRKQRIAQMSLLIADFSRILRMGDDIIINLRKMQDGAMEFDANKVDFTSFCVAVDSYIRINNKLLFEVWASNEEKVIFKDILELVHSWNGQFVKAATKKDTASVPDFGELVENLGDKVYELSAILRSEIEKQI